jgi:hypothetical protein
VAIVEWVRERRLRPLAILAALALPYLVWGVLPPPGRDPASRAARYAAAAAAIAPRSPAYAALHLEEALRLAPEAATAGAVRRRLGELWLAAGDAERALPHVEAIDPGGVAARALREHLGRTGGGAPAPPRGATP